jgi:hypothetical protein
VLARDIGQVRDLLGTAGEDLLPANPTVQDAVEALSNADRCLLAETLVLARWHSHRRTSYPVLSLSDVCRPTVAPSLPGEVIFSASVLLLDTSGHVGVRSGVPACLRNLHFVASACSRDSANLQAFSVCCIHLQSSCRDF